MTHDQARFFEEVVPRLARRKARAFPALAQSICVVVEDRAWTLTLHDDERPVRAGGDPEAGFTLYLSAPAFDALVDGTLDVDRALDARAVGVAGDVRALEQLGRLLGGPRTTVDARTSRGRS
jgi:hypothetical protein